MAIAIAAVDERVPGSQLGARKPQTAFEDRESRRRAHRSRLTQPDRKILSLLDRIRRRRDQRYGADHRETISTPHLSCQGQTTREDDEAIRLFLLLQVTARRDLPAIRIRDLSKPGQPGEVERPSSTRVVNSPSGLCPEKDLKTSPAMAR